MSKAYKGIVLEDNDKEVRFSHSLLANAITDGRLEEDQSTDYFERLLDIDKSVLSSEEFEQVSALNSVANMNYQICNGGIGQYFDNGYHKYRKPNSDNDVAQVDKEKQEEMLDTLFRFGAEVFPEKRTENRTLEVVVEQFKDIYMDTVYDEDYGWDDNILRGDAGFDRLYYRVSDYLETLMECYAQYLTKSIEKELINKKDKIDNLIKNAENRSTKSSFKEFSEKEIELEI